VMPLEAIMPGERDPEPDGKYVDARFRPSFVDCGHLQTLSCDMSVAWMEKGHEAYPSEYLSDVRIMINRYVRHVKRIEISDTGVVTFFTKDKWSTFAYSFELNEYWFARKRPSNKA